MIKPLVALDLDDTLLKNRALIRGVWEYLAKYYSASGIDADIEFEALNEYYVETDGGRAYNFSKHLQAARLNPDEVYAVLSQSELADGRYEIEGLGAFLDDLQKRAKVVVLTYGFDDYQRFKAGLCPSLGGIEIITTLKGKGKVLAEMGGVDFMVDDRLITDLPDSVQFVMVNLVGKPIDKRLVEPVFADLKDVKEYLYDKMH